MEKDYKFIELAIKIIERVLDDYRWENGLIPTIPDKNFNSLDIQTDFIASSWRISEITGDKKYKEISYQIYDSVLKYHGSEHGLCNSVDRDGKKGGKIFPKYNALFLKAMILIENKDFKIYENKYTHGLMKDR